MRALCLSETAFDSNQERQRVRGHGGRDEQVTRQFAVCPKLKMIVNFGQYPILSLKLEERFSAALPFAKCSQTRDDFDAMTTIASDVFQQFTQVVSICLISSEFLKAGVRAVNYR